MTEMVHSASVLHSDSKFDGFLFAPVGEDGKGMIVSVVSALARLGFDPRTKAAELAGLPRDSAERQLAAAVAELPDVPLAKTEAATIAARLIALLPVGAVAGKSADGTATRMPFANKYVIGWALALFLILSAQNFVAIELSQQPQAGAASAAAATTTTPPPAAGK